MADHGFSEFDRKYYRRFFLNYGKEELEMYYRWSLGWAKFLDNYLDLREGKSKKALELGCSIGAFSKVLEERGYKVIATDISSYILDKARRLQKSIHFKVLDIEKDRKNEDFDYVFAFEVLEHLKNPENALKNISNKLKKGGFLVFSTPFPTKRSLKDPTHINVHEQSWWLKLGKKVGFQKMKVIYATFIPFLYRISKYLSIGFPIRLNLPYVNSTCFLIFEK